MTGSPPMFTATELSAIGLSTYLRQPCGCNSDLYRSVPLICVDGHRQYRIECIACERCTGSQAIPRRKINYGMISHRITRSNVTAIVSAKTEQRHE